MTQRIEVRAPFDGDLIGTVGEATAEDVERALSTAHQLFGARSLWLPKQKRIDILLRAAAIIMSRRQELALQAAHEGGKPLSDSLIEIDRGIEGIHNCVDELRTHAGHVVPMELNASSANRVAFTRYEPIGVVVGVSAFNHPFNLVIHQLAPAIAVGAPIIIKPAPATPLSCRALISIFTEAGLPDGWAQMVLPLDLDVAGKLITDPRVGFFTFIGSAKVGWTLRSKLSPGTRCALEHGGAAPVIVAQDADLAMAIPRIVRGGFFHAGQACVSVQRVFCHRSIAEEVATRTAEAADRLVIGDPTLATTDVGPLINHREVERVDSWVKEAVEQGARLVTGGKVLDNNRYANTVLLNPPDTCTIMRNEVFGPVVCICAYDDLDAAIATANDLPYAFQSAVFTRDIDVAMHCYDRLDGSAIMVNENSLFRLDSMPFAGLRASGLGVGGIRYTMSEMRIEKMMVWRSDALK